MRNVLRWTIPLAVLAVLALLLALNRRWPLIGGVVAGLVLALTIVGSVIKLWRVGHGDFRTTSREFFLPKRWRSWMFGEEHQGRQEPPNSK
jgi:hypothetical protein